MPDKNTPQFFPQPFPSAPCDTFNCRNRAKWFIGRPDGPLNICLRLCDDCARVILLNLPAELRPVDVPVEQTVPPENTTSEQSEVVRCDTCGREFTGQTARFKLSAHKRGCKG